MKIKSKLPLLWLVILLTNGTFHSFASKQDSVIILSKASDFIPLNLASYILKDHQGRLSYQVVSKNNTWFEPLKDEIFNFNTNPYTKVFWVRTTLNNTSTKNLEYFLYLHPGLDTVEVFITNPNGQTNRERTSSFSSTHTRPYYISQELALPIVLQPGVSKIYFRIVNRSLWSREMGSIIIALAEQKDFLNYFLESRFLQGIALGMLFLLLIFHFFLYIFFKDATYKAFLVNIFFTLVYLLLRKNFQLEFNFLSPHFELVTYLHDPASILVSLTAVWFSRLFLNTKEKDVLFDNIMNFIMILQFSVMIVALSFQTLRLLNELSIYLGFISTLVVIIASVRSYLRGNKLSLYVFFGFVLLGGIPIIYLLPLPNYLHYRTSETDVHYFGEAFRAIIFAIGIADRFYQLKKEVAQKELENKQLVFIQERKLQEERERISRDLHDNIGSHLALLTMELSVLSQRFENSLELEAAKENTKIIINQLRETVWVLENDEVTVNDIENKLMVLILPIHSLTKIQVSLEIPESLRDTKLKPSQAINLYRISQEAIQNSIKHGHCSIIKVNFGVDLIANKLFVQVADNGNGFALEDVNKNGHFGIRNMHKRAQEIDGVLEIISTVDKGTIITLFVPLFTS